jgi:tetratricopeptide (TPR) repeat protein
MLDLMRASVLLLLALLLALPARAQKTAADQIVEAFHLWSAGQERAAITILEPIVQSRVNAVAEMDLGVAWNVLGSCYLDLEMYDEARRAYQHAVEILRPIPEAQMQYASTMDNLGVLEKALGEGDSARVLCEKARHIDEKLGDSAGVAITSTNLAVIGIAQHDFKAARRAFERASQEAQHATAMKEDDIAAIDSVESALALHDGREDEAISAVQRAIDRWTRVHGPGFFMIGPGYLLRAQAFAKIGDYARATADAQHAMDIAEAAIGKNTFAYLMAEDEYARILRASGDKEQASRLQKQAAGGLAQIESRQCGGCTMNVSGYR